MVFDRLALYTVGQFVLPVVPLLTDLLETGSLPHTPRQWLTEAVVGTLLALMVWRLRRDMRHLVELSRTDPLTRLGHRRTFDDALDREIARARRLRYPLCLLYLDVDHFKAVNDNLGHEAGDEVLRQVAQAIGREARAALDLAFRLGGDEFVLLLPGCRGDQAALVAERIRQRFVPVHALPLDPAPALSIGIAELADGESADGLVRRADAAMYARKRERSAASSPLAMTRTPLRR